jgi:hypothetical protein
VTDHHDANVQCDAAAVQKLNAFPSTATAESLSQATGGTDIINRN